MTNDVANWEKPLLGAQFCCTSIAPEIRSELAEWLQDMGADHTLDLTSDVTHLLVGDTDSKKYQYVAREREDVKVLLPGFVGAIRNLWMNDQPIDFNALESEYRCPTLYGLRVSITGFEDLAFRNELAKNITENGGGYSGDLTKDLTHLIANAAVGKKFEYATAWGLKVVSLKWYKDTLDRGMQLDESKYHPALPPQQQGLGAWIRQSTDSPKLGKRQRENLPEEKPNRKLRRTASARFGSQQTDMWNEIAGPRASEPAENVTAQISHARSMSNIGFEIQNDGTNSYLAKKPSPAQVLPPSGPESNVTGMFVEKYFVTRGFDAQKKSVLYQHLTGNGAIVYETLSELKQMPQASAELCFVMVPYDIQESQLNILKQSCPNINIVTELWLEYCISTKQFIAPDEYVLGQPAVMINLPIMSRLVLNASGFPQIQTLHISKVVRKLGARYEEKFTPDTSVLICNLSSLNYQKIDHAHAWQIPVVSEKWLWKLIKSKRPPPQDPFRIPHQSVSRSKQNSQSQRLTELNQTDETQRSSSRSTRQVSESEQDDSFIAAVKARQPQQDFASLNDGFAQDKPSRRSGEHISKRNVSDAKTQRSWTVMPTPMPLQEISSNIRHKQPPSAKAKRRLFQQYDGNNSNPTELVPQLSHPTKNLIDQESLNEAAENSSHSDDLSARDLENSDLMQSSKSNPHSKLINEFLAVKNAAESRAVAEATKPANSKPSNKKLLGRALSNLSNSSNKSRGDSDAADLTRPPLSRASSINSVNTDGLGMPLSMMSRIPSDLKRRNSDIVNMPPPSPSDFDFHAALTSLSTSQLPHPPSPSQPAQLTYADSEEAVALKAHLAEKRRNRAKIGQNVGDPEPKLSREESEEKRQQAWREKRKDTEDGLMDDEAIVGVGRRTRGREKALRMALGDAEADRLQEEHVFH